MVTVRDLHCGYRASEVLSGVSLEVPEGRLAALLGRNGMGKTSLCRSIMGLRPPTISGGEITFGEHKLTDLAPYQVARLGIGYVPQGRRIFPSLDVVENLTVAARSSGNGEGWTLERVWEAFPRLEERRNSRGGQLSGGEQQMLAIARALMTDPTLLIMDEPSEGLAPVIVDSLGKRLIELKQSSLSMLLVEQNFSLAMKLADVVYIIENGRIVFEGTPEELDRDDEVKRRHLGVGV